MSVCRFVYNHSLSDWYEQFKRRQWIWVPDEKIIARRQWLTKLPSEYDQSKEWTKAWKELPDEQREWFKTCPSNAWRSAITDFHVAVDKFFKGEVRGGLNGLKYRSFRDDQSFELPVRSVGGGFKGGYQTNIWFGPRQVMLSKKHKLKIDYKKHRRLGGTPKTVRVIREGTIENPTYYISVVVETKNVDRDRPIVEDKVGVDFGIVTTLSLSTGESINPLEYKVVIPRLTKRMKKLQRELSKARRGSKRRLKKKIDLALIHKRISKIRSSTNHRMTTALARAFSTVVVEKLNIRGMTRSAKGTQEAPGKNVNAKSGLNREILNRAPGQIRSQLKYKIERRGGTLIAVDPRYTSQQCSHCGTVDSESRKSQSDYQCVHCGFIINADHNAAINILNRGLTEESGVVPVPRKTPSDGFFEMKSTATSKSARWMTESGLHRSDLAALWSTIRQPKQWDRSTSVSRTPANCGHSGTCTPTTAGSRTPAKGGSFKSGLIRDRGGFVLPRIP